MHALGFVSHAQAERKKALSLAGSIAPAEVTSRYIYANGNQYVLTSVHRTWLHARCTDNAAGGRGLIAARTAKLVIVVLYDAPTLPSEASHWASQLERAATRVIG